MARPDFTCPQCGNHTVEEVMENVTVSSEVLDLKEGDGEELIDYGEQRNDDGDVVCYQCIHCGHLISEGPNSLAKALKELKEEQDEQKRRDEKNGLYSDKEDPAN